VLSAVTPLPPHRHPSCLRFRLRLRWRTRLPLLLHFPALHPQHFCPTLPPHPTQKPYTHPAPTQPTWARLDEYAPPPRGPAVPPRVAAVHAVQGAQLQIEASPQAVQQVLVQPAVLTKLAAPGLLQGWAVWGGGRGMSGSRCSYSQRPFPSITLAGCIAAPGQLAAWQQAQGGRLQQSSRGTCCRHPPLGPLTVSFTSPSASEL